MLADVSHGSFSTDALRIVGRSMSASAGKRRTGAGPEALRLAPRCPAMRRSKSSRTYPMPCIDSRQPACLARGDPDRDQFVGGQLPTCRCFYVPVFAEICCCQAASIRMNAAVRSDQTELRTQAGYAVVVHVQFILREKRASLASVGPDSAQFAKVVLETPR